MGQRANIELAEMRNDDLLRAVREVVANYDVETDYEAVLLAINSPSKRYWCTASAAAKALWRLAKGDTLPEMRPTSRERYQSLYDLYLRMREEDQYKGKSIYYISCLLVEQPAPKFFLTPKTAEKIYHKWRKKRLCERLAQM